MTPLTFFQGKKDDLISRLPGGKIVLLAHNAQIPSDFKPGVSWLCEVREPKGGKVAFAQPVQVDPEVARKAEEDSKWNARLEEIKAEGRLRDALQKEAMTLSPVELMAAHPDLRVELDTDLRCLKFGLQGWTWNSAEVPLEAALVGGWAAQLKIVESYGVAVAVFPKEGGGVALVRTLDMRDSRKRAVVATLSQKQLEEVKRVGGANIGCLLAPPPTPGDVRIELGPVGTALRDGPVEVGPHQIHVWSTVDEDRHSGIGEPGSYEWRMIGGVRVTLHPWAEEADPTDKALRYAALESLKLGALQAISPQLSPQGETARVADVRLWKSWTESQRLEFLERVRAVVATPAGLEMTPGDRITCKEAAANPAVAAYFRVCASDLGLSVGLRSVSWRAGSDGYRTRAGVFCVGAERSREAEAVVSWVRTQPADFPAEQWDTYNRRDTLTLRNVPVVTGDTAPSAAALGRLYASMPPEWQADHDAAETAMVSGIRTVLDGWAATVAGKAAEEARIRAEADAAEKARHGTPAPAPWYCFGTEESAVLAAHPTLRAGIGVSRLTRGSKYQPELVPGSSCLLALVSTGGRGGKRHSYRINWELSVGVHSLSYEGDRSEIRLIAAVDPGFILVAESYTNGMLNWSRAWNASGECDAPAPVPTKTAGFGSFADLLKR